MGKEILKIQAENTCWPIPIVLYPCRVNDIPGCSIRIKRSSLSAYHVVWCFGHNTYDILCWCRQSHTDKVKLKKVTSYTDPIIRMKRKEVKRKRREKKKKQRVRRKIKEDRKEILWFPLSHTGTLTRVFLWFQWMHGDKKISVFFSLPDVAASHFSWFRSFFCCSFNRLLSWSYNFRRSPTV